MYFDYAASSIKRKDIIKDLIDNIDLYEANPNATYALGRTSKMHLENARKKIANSINTNSNHIIFTSGASESNNMIINNFKNQNIITSKIEHKSILEPVKANCGNNIFINVNENGIIDFEEFKSQINEDTNLVSIMYVNNETGVIQPVKKIGKYINEINKKEGYNIWFHIDTVQAYGHIDIDVEKLYCDSLSLSGHKIGGLNGVGALYIKNRIEPFIFGGGQESGIRSGTQNVIGAMSMANSIEKLKEEYEQVLNIKKYFLNNLKVPYEINGDINNTVNHIVNLYFPFVKSDLLLTFLDTKNIFVSAGSACNAGALEPSYVIEEMYNEDRAIHSIRFSFGFTNTKEEVDILIKAIEEMYERKK